MESKYLKILNELEELLSRGECNEIKSKLNEFISQNRKMLKRFSKIINLSDSQQFELLKLKEKLETTNMQLSLLLDNANEGFLYVNKELKIEPVYSKIVEKIFNKNIGGEYIYDLLFEKKEFYKETLEDILHADDLKSEVLLSLLPKKKTINSKIIKIEYKKLPNNSLMLILRDETKSIMLEKKAIEEERKLKMVVEVLISMEQFLEIKAKYEEFAKNFFEIDDLNDLKAKVHTFKGLFSQKYMQNVVNKLHELEEKIINRDFNYIKSLNEKILLSWIEKDINELKKEIGKEFFKKATYKYIDSKRLKSLYYEAKIGKTERNILQKIKELTFFNVEDFILPFKNLIKELGIRYNKQIDFKYNCKVYLPDIYKSLFLSLVHIFRNSVYHGIEEGNERVAKGKDIKGVINFRVYKNKNIIIEIEDDGAGIDINKLSQKAGKNVKQSDIKDYIFKNGFSTSEEINLTAGRGIGLYSIYKEVKKFNGKIDIINNPGKGVKFIITLPFIQNDDMEIVLDVLSEVVKEYFSDFNYITERIEYNNEYKIKNHSSCVGLTGDIESFVFIECDKRSTYNIANKFIYEDKKEAFIKEHMDDVLKEVLNIFAGKIIKPLKKFGINIDITPPFEYKSQVNALYKELIFANSIVKIGIKV